MHGLNIFTLAKLIINSQSNIKCNFKKKIIALVCISLLQLTNLKTKNRNY